ncbi:MAG: hypothetical protein JXA93_02955 [Anaerolineae bacterium]|nr:hypothetical protein [Anaerolineae bacterium]
MKRLPLRKNQVGSPRALDRGWSLSDHTLHVPIVLALACLLSVLFLLFNWIDLIDDAYIFFRYAHNIRLGLGYVFNPGQPVEGTTSLTWTLLLAGLDLLGLPLDLSAQVLGIVSILIVLCLLARFFSTASVSPAIVALVFALLLFDSDFPLSMMMGMETGLYSVLLLVLLVACRRYVEQADDLSAALLGVMGLLLFLTRPESVFLLGLLGSIFLFRREGRSLRLVLVPILVWGAGIAAVTLWRWLTFGDFVPNSVRAKSLLSWSAASWSIWGPRVVAGGTYLGQFIISAWPLALLALAGLWSWRGLSLRLVALSILFTAGVTSVANSGDWMPLFRLVTPYLPVVAALAGVGTERLRSSLAGKWRRAAAYGAVAVAALIALTALVELRGNGLLVATKWPAGVCYEQSARALRPYLTEQTAIAPEAVGKIGYALANTPIIDFFGLTDPHIARHGVVPLATYSMGKHDYEYVMGQQPALFIFHSDIVNHIPLLNRWGYSVQYGTFTISDRDAGCELLVGIKSALVPLFLPALDQRFEVHLVDTSGLQANPAATWPLGEE